MIGTFQLKGGISEPSSDITLNWRDMRSKFGYTTLYGIMAEIYNRALGINIKNG